MKLFTPVAMLLACCTGCGTISATTPQWDSRFGDATRAAFAQQVLHPEAGRANRSVDGIDGASAAAAQERYRKSFTEPPPPAAAFTIGMSGSK